MNLLIKILTKFGILKEDLDYHLIRASMVVGKWITGFHHGVNSPERWHAHER